MEPPVRIYKRPQLKNPSLVVGWADSGLVGINAVDYLANKLGAEEFGEIEPYDFSSLPQILIKEGVIQEIEYPRNRFYYWKNKGTAGDLIILGSNPPVVYHYKFVNLILDVAELFDVTRIYTVGGINANVAHTERPRVFTIINNPGLRHYVTQHDIDLAGIDYQGPTSMNGLILGIAKHRNLEGISLWGQVPSYISEIPNPQVSEAVLRVLTRMLGIVIDFSEIEAQARRSIRQINRLVSYIRRQNPALDRHIGMLEKGMSAETTPEDRQRFFEEIEEFLRNQQGRRENDQSDK